MTKEDCISGITVDLREPLFEDGVLSTEKGGVITGPHLRIQALSLRYTRINDKDSSVATVEAEGQLIVEFGEYIFIGQKLFYDFQKNEGFIDCARTAIEPWYFGGERIELRPDGSYIIYNGYLTTSEKDQPEWAIYSKKVHIEKEQYLKAYQVQLQLYRYPILWIPSLSANLNSIFDSPIRYRFHWGGKQGPRLGLTYEIFSWERWKTFLRFDYRLTRGPGGGIETKYKSKDGKTEFRSINYIAQDSSLLDPNKKIIYRFEGFFKSKFDNDKTTILASYDKISGRDTPSQYYDEDFEFDRSERTQLLIRRQEENWIGNFYTRLRINSFQTVKQELPSLSVNYKPFSYPTTGIIFENWSKASYLDFAYSKHLADVHNYHSSRFEYRPTFYAPFNYGPVTFTPEIGGVGIFYGDSPKKESQLLLVGRLGWNAETQLFRFYGPLKHVIEPYCSYHYLSCPTSSADQHYIFDINDGWSYLNMLTTGVRNSLYSKSKKGEISRLFFGEIYTHAFLKSPTELPTIPKIYSRLIFSALPTLRHTVRTAWDFEHNVLDHFNFLTEWTLSDDFAFSAEYAHRSPYRWRKVDQDNFFLENYRPVKCLLHSSLSDRRDTFLFHFFYRFHPNWACKFSSRKGWNRRHEPNYLEYEIDLLTTIQTAWHLKLSFQHRENDNRVALYFNVGLAKPNVNNLPRIDHFN
ncbi:MAG: hypothetical protein H0V82_11435 [Candidatus Protochlamydia sp.]|nr:hypothetical protein [Candidatus Protochlamydia sp.]